MKVPLMVSFTFVCFGTGLFAQKRPLDSTKIPEGFLSVAGAERKDWFLADPMTDTLAGISLYKAKELLKGKQPRKVIVAIIDNGVDIAHPALLPHIWTNPGEIPGNGIDDDKNGYVDDIHGWNFRGKADGTIVENEQAGATQFYLAFKEKFLNTDTTKLDPAGNRQWLIFQKARKEFLAKTGGKMDSLESAIVFNPSYYSAALVAGKNRNRSTPFYGSPLWHLIPNLSHGTHVAGIVTRIIDDVVIMPVIASTAAGDERDEDVANAIRYAVDNGAQIINISFSKTFSPQKELVDAAVKYAAQKNVLIIHCAGNDGVDLDDEGNDHYPVKRYLDGGSADNFITVGWNRPLFNYRLVHTSGDYGKRNVDLYAPGSDIWSAVPGGGFDFKSGSSMSTPVVSGVAALLLSYFPSLTVAQLKNILLRSTFKPVIQVNKPKTTFPVAFSSLSVTGGIVNAYNAVKMAAMQ